MASILLARWSGGSDAESTLPTHQDLTNLVNTGIAFLVLTWIAFLIRAFTKIYIIKSIRPDDVTLLGGQLIYTILAAGSIPVVAREAHPELLAVPHNLKVLQNWIIACTSSYYLSMMLIKTSISLTFIRIFSQSPYKVHTIYAVLVLTVASGLVCTVLGILFFEKFNPGAAGTTASHKFDVLNIVFSGLNSAIDILIAVFAVMAIAAVKMRRSERISASALVLVGTSGCVISILRLVLVSRYSASSNVKAGVRTELWSTLDAGVALIAVSLMATRPLLNTFGKKFGLMSSKGGTFTSAAGQNDTARSRVKLDGSKISYQVNVAVIHKEVSVDVV